MNNKYVVLLGSKILKTFICFMSISKYLTLIWTSSEHERTKNGNFELQASTNAHFSERERVSIEQFKVRHNTNSNIQEIRYFLFHFPLEFDKSLMNNETKKCYISNILMNILFDFNFRLSRWSSFEWIWWSQCQIMELITRYWHYLMLYLSEIPTFSVEVWIVFLKSEAGIKVEIIIENFR